MATFVNNLKVLLHFSRYMLKFAYVVHKKGVGAMGKRGFEKSAVVAARVRRVEYARYVAQARARDITVSELARRALAAWLSQGGRHGN